MAHAIKPTGKKPKKSDVKTEAKTMDRPSKKGRKVRGHPGDPGVPDYNQAKKPVVVAPVQPSKKAKARVNYDDVSLADLRPPVFSLKPICIGRDSVTVECTCVATGGKTVRTARKDRVSNDILIQAWTKV